MGRLLALAESIGRDTRDDEETRVRKRLAVAFDLTFFPLPLLWGLLYLAYGEVVAAAIPIAYDVVVAIGLLIFWRTKVWRPYRDLHFALFIALPFLLQLALGGLAASSAVVMWSVVAPFAALVFAGIRPATIWLAIFLAELAVTAFLDARLAGTNALPDALRTAFFALNIGGLASMATILMSAFVHQREQALRDLRLEQERSESLLLNVLPKEIAPRLKAGESPIADHYEHATVLFADIVGSTALMEKLPPREAVALLNDVFSRFDVLADRHGVEKVRTIGDNWMCVSGVPVARPDHAAAVARMALDMRAYLDELRARGEDRIDFRIGVNSGPLVGGVIGLRKFVFDVWGDPVNTASRMESHGVPGRIHVSESTYDLLRGEFDLEPRGTVEVKGKGAMRTWFLVGERRAASAAARSSLPAS